MSDVSGIPYMGPMGQGNFFAPTFSYNPQMSAGQISSTYMPEIANNQNVVNNLFNTPGGGGGFGQATNYYSQLGANYLAQVPSSWENPYVQGAIVPPSLRVEGGNYANGGGIFDQGAVNNFITGGGGFNFPSSGGGAPAINWNTIFQSAGGGLGGSPRLNLSDVQTWAGNWNTPQSSAFDFSGGGTRDPFPNMAMPGGLNSPMTTPQQQPLDYGSLFGRGVGGTGGAPQQPPYTSGIAPDETGGQTLDAPMTGAPSSSLDWSTLFPKGDPAPGMAMPGGLGSPMTIPEQQTPAYDYGSLFGKGTSGTAQGAPEGTRTYDLAPMFEGGGGGGFGTGGADTSGLFGATAPSMDGNAFSYNKDPMWQDTSPDALAAQARARLAELMKPPAEPTAEPPAAPPAVAADETVTPPYPIPLPRDRPAGADAPRPPETVPPAAPAVEPPAALPEGASRPPARVAFTVEPGKEERVAGVNPRLRTAVEGGAQFLPPGYSVEVFSGVRYDSPEHKQAYHRIIDGSGRAMDVRIIGPDGPITPEGNDYTGMYTLLARGVKTWVAQNDPGAVSGYGGAFASDKTGRNPDLMHFDQGPNRGSLRPDVQFDTLRPLSEVERNAMPAYIPMLGENQVPLDRPVPLGPGYSAPVPPLTDYALPTVPAYRASGMSARDSAAPAPGRRSDLGTSDATDFSAQARSGAPDRGMDPSYWADVLSNDAEPSAVDNVVGPRSSAFGFDPGGYGEGGYGNAFEGGFNALDAAATPDAANLPPSAFPGEAGRGGYLRDTLARQLAGNVADAFKQATSPGRKSMDFSGFSPSPEERKGGVGPQATLEPDFMDVIKEVESSGNPDKVKGSYKGLYQLNDAEFRKYGGTGSIFDPEQNTKAASAKMIDENQRVQDRLGRALTPPEQYMVHQQGVAGSLAHLANPDQLAWKNFQSASKWNDADAKEAIWGNMTPEMQKQFGSVDNLTSRDFLRLWDDRYYEILNR